MTNSDVKASFSNYGTAAFVSAPGYGLYTAHPNHQISHVAGTSYAAPVVAAEAALVMDAYQRAFRGQPDSSFVNSAISKSAKDIDLLNLPYTARSVAAGFIFHALSTGLHSVNRWE